MQPSSVQLSPLPTSHVETPRRKPWENVGMSMREHMVHPEN
jgi:hypothetical protein